MRSRKVHTEASNGGIDCYGNKTEEIILDPCPGNFMRFLYFCIHDFSSLENKSTLLHRLISKNSKNIKTLFDVSGDCKPSPWGDCSKDCGPGVRNRTILIHMEHNGTECKGPLTEYCNNGPCPGM